MKMECMKIGPEKVDAMVDYAFGNIENAHNQSLNGHLGQTYEDGLNGQAVEVIDNPVDLNDNMEPPGATHSMEISNPLMKSFQDQTNCPRLPSSLEASTGSGYFIDDDFSAEFDGGYAAIDQETFDNEDISSFFAVYNHKAPAESKMMLVRTRSDSCLYNYELELSMSERTSSRGQSSSGYDCGSSAEVSFRSDQVYSPQMNHSSLQSGPLFSSATDMNGLPHQFYSTDSLDHADISCSMATEEDFNLEACYANKDNYILAFDRSPTKYSDDDQEYHDAWLSDATENLAGEIDEVQTDSEYMCDEMDHSAGEVVYLDDYYSNEHEPLLAEHMMLNSNHEALTTLGAEGAAADAASVNIAGVVVDDWNDDEGLSDEFGSDDTQIVAEDCGYKSASDQDDVAVNFNRGADQANIDISDEEGDTMDDYDSQLLDEIDRELQSSYENIAQSFAYDNMTFEPEHELKTDDDNLGIFNERMNGAGGFEDFSHVTRNITPMAASDSAQLISPDCEMMYSYPEGLSEVLAGRINGGRLLRRWRNIQQNLDNVSSSEPTTASEPSDSIEIGSPSKMLTTFATVRQNSLTPTNDLTDMTETFSSSGTKVNSHTEDSLDTAPKGGATATDSVKAKMKDGTDSAGEKSWKTFGASGASCPSAATHLTTWKQVKKGRTPQTSWKKIKEMKQLLRDEDSLSSNSSKCKSAPNLVRECGSPVNDQEETCVRYREKRSQFEDEANKRHSFTLFEIFRRTKSEDAEYGKLPSPILQKLYGSLVSNDGFFLNGPLDSVHSIRSNSSGMSGCSRSNPWSLYPSESFINQARASSSNRINSCLATPGSFSNESCDLSPASDANLVPPPYDPPTTVTYQGNERLSTKDVSPPRDTISKGLVQEFSLLPIIQPRFTLSNDSNVSDNSPEPFFTTFAHHAPKSEKRTLEFSKESQNKGYPCGLSSHVRGFSDPCLRDSTGGFMDSINLNSSEEKEHYICKGVQTSVSLTDMGRVPQSVQTSIEGSESCDKSDLLMELKKANTLSITNSPVLHVGSSPTSQSSHSNESDKENAFFEDAKKSATTSPRSPVKEKLSRSVMFTKKGLPDLSFLNLQGMSKSTTPTNAKLHKPQRSKSCDYSSNLPSFETFEMLRDMPANRRREEWQKLNRGTAPAQLKLDYQNVDPVANSTSSVSELKGSAEKSAPSKCPASSKKNKRVTTIMNNAPRLDNSTSSLDSVSRHNGTGKQIDMVRNGEKNSTRRTNKMTNLEKDWKDNSPKVSPEVDASHRDQKGAAYRDQSTGYHGDLSSNGSSGMEVSSDSQSSRYSGCWRDNLPNSPRMSRRDLHVHGGNTQSSSRCRRQKSPYCWHCQRSSNLLCSACCGHICNQRAQGICQSCFPEDMCCAHHRNGYVGPRSHDHSSSHHHHNRGNRRAHSEVSSSSEYSQAYYSDDDYHTRRRAPCGMYNVHQLGSGRRLNSCETDARGPEFRVSSLQEFSSDEDHRSQRCTFNQYAFRSDSDASSSDQRQLKPCIKQRSAKRRTCSAPSGSHSPHRHRHCSSSSEHSSETLSSASERSSCPGSDSDRLSEDATAPVSWSSNDHSVVREQTEKVNNPNLMSNSTGSSNGGHHRDDNTSRRKYGVNLQKNDLWQHSCSTVRSGCCSNVHHCHGNHHVFHPPCFMQTMCCHQQQSFMCSCCSASFCCGESDMGSRSGRHKKSVSFSEEIKYHSPYSSPHCSPKKQQKVPGNFRDENDGTSEERGRSIALEEGCYYPETHVSESSVDSAFGSESPPREFQISPTKSKTFDFEEIGGDENFRSKRGLVVDVCRAVEVLQNHYSGATASQERVHLGTSADCPKVGSLLLSHLCPALFNLLSDGLRQRIHSFFGQVKNNMWKVVEESSEQCSSTTKIMSEIAKEVKKQIRLGSNLSKFNAFVFGLLNAKALDHWLTILASQEKLIRKHYGPDSFMALSLSSRGQHLFDDVIQACQPLASLPFRVECNFEFKFRQTLSPRSEAALGLVEDRNTHSIRRRRSSDDLSETTDFDSDKWNGRLQMVQTSNSTLSSSHSSGSQSFRDEQVMQQGCFHREAPTLPDLVQKTDVMQYILQAKEWIENGSKISESAMDYLGQQFHREFGQFSQHPTENNRWSLPPIETVFSLANFFSKSSMQNQCPSVEGFAMYLARISADAERQKQESRPSQAHHGTGVNDLWQRCDEKWETEAVEEEDDLISFDEEESKNTIKEGSPDRCSIPSDLTSLGSDEKDSYSLQDENNYRDGHHGMRPSDAGNRDGDWLINFKPCEDSQAAGSENEEHLVGAVGGMEAVCQNSLVSSSNRSSFEQHLDDMGIVPREPSIELPGIRKRLSCPLLNAAGQSGRDESQKRWSLGASLINVFDKLLLDAPNGQKYMPPESESDSTPSSGQYSVNCSSNPDLSTSSSGSSKCEPFNEGIQLRQSCPGFSGHHIAPPSSVPEVEIRQESTLTLKRSASVTTKETPAVVRPKELPIRRSAILTPKPMTSSSRSEDGPSRAVKRYVQALCYHLASDSEQLSFDKGDIMMTLKELDDEWFFCCHGNKTGLVHRECVKEIEEAEVLRLLKE